MYSSIEEKKCGTQFFLNENSINTIDIYIDDIFMFLNIFGFECSQICIYLRGGGL